MEEATEKLAAHRNRAGLGTTESTSATPRSQMQLVRVERPKPAAETADRPPPSPTPLPEDAPVLPAMPVKAQQSTPAVAATPPPSQSRRRLPSSHSFHQLRRQSQQLRAESGLPTRPGRCLAGASQTCLTCRSWPAAASEGSASTFKEALSSLHQVRIGLSCAPKRPFRRILASGDAAAIPELSFNFPREAVPPPRVRPYRATPAGRSS